MALSESHPSQQGYLPPTELTESDTEHRMVGNCLEYKGPSQASEIWLNKQFNLEPQIIFFWI